MAVQFHSWITWDHPFIRAIYKRALIHAMLVIILRSFYCYVAMSARNSYLSFRLGLRTCLLDLAYVEACCIDRRIRTLSSRGTTTRALGASLLAAAVVAGDRRPSFVFELI